MYFWSFLFFRRCFTAVEELLWLGAAPPLRFSYKMRRGLRVYLVHEQLVRHLFATQTTWKDFQWCQVRRKSHFLAIFSKCRKPEGCTNSIMPCSYFRSNMGKYFSWSWVLKEWWLYQIQTWLRKFTDKRASTLEERNLSLHGVDIIRNITYLRESFWCELQFICFSSNQGEEKK